MAPSSLVNCSLRSLERRNRLKCHCLPCVPNLVRDIRTRGGTGWTGGPNKVDSANMSASAPDRQKATSVYELHSLILACDCRVDDVERMWTWLKGQRSRLASIGAHHVVLYTSIWESGRVLVTIGIRHARPIRELLRSPAVFEWFDVSGVDDIPPIFGGEVVEKIDLYEPSPHDAVTGVVVGTVSSVDDVSALMVNVHDGLDTFRRAGVRKIWVYRALDDGREVMILQEVDNEVSARRWIDHPGCTAQWMSGVGLGPYPPVFVGRFADLMSIDEQGLRVR
jgi:hypothetical protein